MNRIWLRAAEKLEFRDPGHILVKLRKIEHVLATSETPDKVKNLRTNKLKELREIREAALFCYGMSQRI